ncbi:MAG TPA: hypothetical protein VGG74_09615 [Kofleriaceae bacterium]
MTKLGTAVLAIALAACGSSPPPARPPPPAAPPPSGPSQAELAAEQDAQHRAELTEAHHRLEAEQQDALAKTCAEVGPPSHDRCLPSCYATEPADPRATKKLAGAVEVEHLACEAPDGSIVTADELAKSPLHVRPFRRRFPREHKKGTWQQDYEVALNQKLPRGDVVVVTGARRDLTNPLTHEVLHCAPAARYARSVRHPIDRCGSVGDMTCEAAGNAAARAINVAHYRVQEAKRLEAAGNTNDCQQAALEAVAVARGLPRWRQYQKLNVQHWTDHLIYRTRFDGTLDEDALFAAIAKLGSDAESLYASCGGGTAATAVEQEQSFHACW